MQVKVEDKYCKVCHDSGKPESIYKSHFIRESRDPNSRIICPTLLSLECRYCFKKGHTVKYCPANRRQERRHEYKEEEKQCVTHSLEKKRSNIYMILDEEEEEIYSKTQDSKEDEFPELTHIKKAKDIEMPRTISYASVASKAKEEKKVSLPDIDSRIRLAAESIKKPSKPLRWADSDSESEEDEEDVKIAVYSNVEAEIAVVSNDEDDDW